VRYALAVAVVPPPPTLLAEEVTGRDASTRQMHSKTAGKAFRSWRERGPGT